MRFYSSNFGKVGQEKVEIMNLGLGKVFIHWCIGGFYHINISTSGMRDSKWWKFIHQSTQTPKTKPHILNVFQFFQTEMTHTIQDKGITLRITIYLFSLA